MARTYDIEESTSLSVGVENYDSTRAVRGFKVPYSDLSPSSGRTTLNSALVKVIDDHGTNTYGEKVHPDRSDLPLHSVRGVYFGENIIGTALYARTALSTPVAPAFDFAQETPYRAGRRTIRTFPDDDLTVYNWNVGTQTFSDFAGSGWHESMTSVRAEYIRHQLRVKTILDFNPRPAILTNGGLASYYDLQGRVNSDSFEVNGICRPPGTLRFDSVTVAPFRTNSKTRYIVEYSFLEDAHGWFGRILYDKIAYCAGIYKTGSSPATLGHSECLGEDGTTPLTSKQVRVYKELVIAETTTIVEYANNGILTRTYYPVYNPLPFSGLFPTHDSPNGYNGGSC